MTLSTDEQAKLYRYYTEPKMVTELTRWYWRAAKALA